MEVYTAFFNSNMQMQGDIRAEIVSGESFAAALQQGPVYFFGDGSDKCRVVLTHPNARFVDEVVPLAAAMARSEEHTSELQSRPHLVCRLLLEKKKKTQSVCT